MTRIIRYCSKILHNSKNAECLLQKQLLLNNNQDIASISIMLILDSLSFPLSLHDVSGRHAHARSIGKNGVSTHQPQPTQPYSLWPSARGDFSASQPEE